MKKGWSRNEFGWIATQMTRMAEISGADFGGFHFENGVGVGWRGVAFDSTRNLVSASSNPGVWSDINADDADFRRFYLIGFERDG